VYIDVELIVQPPTYPDVFDASLTWLVLGGVYPNALLTFVLLTFEFKVFAAVKLVPPT
jgi:hypothetical protein